MNPTVYSQHAARISKTMLRRAAERLVREGETTAGELRRMDDHDLMAALRRCEATAEDARRYDHRDLFKRAVWAEIEDTPGGLIDADHDEIREYEREIADHAGVDRDCVILDVPDRPSMKESSSRVVVSGEIRRLDRQSPLVEALRAASRSHWRLGVYTPAEHKDSVGMAAVEVLGLELDGALVREVREGLHATLDEFADGA